MEIKTTASNAGSKLLSLAAAVGLALACALAATGAGAATFPLRGGDTTNYSGPYAIYTFTNTVTAALSNTSASAVSVEVLVVGGGGGGGGDLGGGGGGGAVVYIPSATLPAGSTWWVKVGGGGTGAYYNAVGGTGTNSIFSNGTTVVTAAGGGGGGCWQNDGTATGANGGSGGGAGASQTTATSGGLASNALSSLGGFVGTIYGNNGGTVTVARVGAGATSGRGGGGAGAAATSGSAADNPAGPGGDGIAISMGLYPNKYWGGGGGGGAYLANGGAGGKGGGGGGATYSSTLGKGDTNGLNAATDGGAGTDSNGGAGGVNTGGGGGGGTYQKSTGGKGGSGIVIVRYTVTNLTIENGAALTGANLGTTQATVTATVWTNGGSDATGYLFYDMVDRGTNLTWAYTNWSGALSSASGATVTNTLSNLVVNTRYYFMYYATNTGGQTCWGGASGVPFTTADNKIIWGQGGDTVTNYLLNGTNFIVHIYTNTAAAGRFVAALPGAIEALVVGGGGGGGGYIYGGGGGAGGLVYTGAYAVVAGSNYAVTVGIGGAGGSGAGISGSNSVFGGLTAYGGGGGGGNRNTATRNGLAGGSGGGGVCGATATGVGGTNQPAGQGYPGGNGYANDNGGSGGGGGAGAKGADGSATPGGKGGDGLAYSLVGSNVYYAGGGGGSAFNVGPGGAGGLGGGGTGADARAGYYTPAGGNGSPNTGGGGGGGEVYTAGGSGGSGIVIVRYAVSNLWVQNGPAPTQGALWTTQAVATATVLTNGGSDATGYLFWDITDHGHALQWPCSSGPIALPANGVVTGTMTNLAPNTTYYCTWFATNTAGQTCWGGTTSLVFTTLSGAPAVTNTGVSAVWYNTATLNGTLTTGTTAWCAFYWWANSTPATTNVAAFGWVNQGASFSSAIGLSPNTTYSYQCMASNNAGVAVSDVKSFTTTLDSDAIWTNTSGGSFATGANWDIGAAPPPNRKATFPSNATYRVDFPGTFTNKAADFEAAGGTVTLNIGGGTGSAYTNIWALTNAFSLGTNAGAFATVAVTSGTLRATAGTLTLGNGVITNSGSGVIEVGTPGVTSYPLLYVPANMTCTVSQVTIRGSNLNYDHTWSCGGPGTLVLNSAFQRSPDLIGDLNGSISTHFTVSNGTIKAGAANVFGLPSVNNGGYLTVTNATLDMNGYAQPINPQNNIVIAANATLINSGASATWTDFGTSGDSFAVYGTVADGTPGDKDATGVISFWTYQQVYFYRGGQTLNNLRGRAGDAASGTYYLYSTNSTDHNTIYGVVAPQTTYAYLYADTAGNISRTLGGKEANGTTDRFVTIGGGVNLYIKGDGGANLSNGSYTNNNDYSGGTMTLDRNASDSISKNVTYTMRNLANGVTVNTGTNGFRLRFQGTNTLTASSTHTVTGTLLINQIAESGGARSLTKAGTGTLELYGSSLFSTNIMQTGTNIISGSVTNRYVEIWSNAVLSLASSGYLRVTNNLMNTNGASTVKFTASPTALGRVDVTGIWSNSATTKLAVDLTGYTWPSGPRAVLATFQSMPTLFAAGNTTIAGAKAVSVYYTPTTLELRKMVGTAVFFQ